MKNNNKKPGQALLALIRKNRLAYFGAAVSTVMVVLLTFATPILLAEIVDSILGSEASTLPEFILTPIRALGGRDWVRAHLWTAAVVLILMNLLNGVFTYLKGRLSAIASENIALSLRTDLYEHLHRVPFVYHAKAETGDLIQRCTSDVDTIRRFLSVQIMEVVSTIMMIIVALIILLQRNVKLTAISMMLVPGLFLFAMWFFKGVHKAFRRSDEAEGRLSAVLQENLSGVRVVRAFGQQQREVEKFDQVSSDYRNKNYRLMNLLAIYWAGGDAVSMLQQLISLIVCVVYAVRGEITVGTLILFTNYISQLLFPIRQLGRTLSDTGKSLVAMERIQEILHAETEPEEPDAVKPPLSGDIVFDHVSFAYPDDNIPVLHDICCTIPAGRTTAILGATGSGKSTMMLMLQRLYEPTGGQVTIGGVDITKIDRHYLRGRVGLVLQESFLYSRTILDNIGIALRNPNREKIEHAAGTASATGFISRADKGWETIVGEKGVTLSGGQKQRIAIARTLMKDNSILVFDDSLSAVDTETDAQIRDTLSRENGGTTRIIISHRITTLSQADLILVLEDGRITQQGTHEQLIRQDGLYRRVNNIQTALEDEIRQAKEEVTG